jgi:hypothetical protein
MRFSIVSILFIGLVILACNKNSRVNDDCESGCKPNRVCTEEFRSLMVQVINRSHAGVELDSFKVIRVSDQKIILDNSKWQPSPGVSYMPGTYLVYSDAYRDETSVCGEDFVFKGYLDNQAVANGVFKIADDCCHINLISGDTKIVIDK